MRSEGWKRRRKSRWRAGAAGLGFAVMGGWAASPWTAGPAAAASGAGGEGPAATAPGEERAVDGGGGLKVRLPETSTSGAWAELTTLGRRVRQEVLTLGEGQREGWIDGAVDGKALLCYGGERVATRCEQLEIAPGTVIELPEVEGVDLVGRFVQGKAPVAARVAVAPADLAFPIMFTIPLAADGEELLREVETDGAAYFRVPRLAPGDYLLEAELASGRIYRSERITVPRPAELRGGRAREDPAAARVYDLGEILVESGLTVEFFVTDVHGEPLSGATAGYSQRRGPLSFEGFKAETDGEGRARVSGLDPQIPGQATCRKPGYRFVRRAFDLPPAHVDCVLEPLARLTGQVVDGEGDGVAATVTLESGDPASRPAHESADRGGVFTFDDLPAGEYALVVAAPGFGAERVRFTLEAGDELELDALTLLPGRELWGVVVDSGAGEPVAAAAVRIARPPGGGETVTDDAGEFRLTTDFAEALWLRVDSERHAPRRVEVEPSRLDGEEPVEIRLSAGGRILAEVFDESTGLPCEGCRVQFGSGGPRSTDAEGRALSAPLEPGRHAVQLERVQSQGSMIVRHGGQEVHLATVRSGETVTVRFGEPKTILEVSFDRPLPAGWNLLTRGASLGHYRPEGAGAFRVRWRPGELTELVLSEAVPGSARRTWLGAIPPDHDAAVLELKLWDTLVTGQLLEGETPGAGRAVELRSPVDSRARAWAATDAAGRFALPFVAPGNYTLVVDGHTVRVVAVREHHAEPLSEIRLPARPRSVSTADM